MENRLVVVKIGTTSLTGSNGGIDAQKLKAATDMLAALRRKKHQVLLVTSGAIAAGFGRLGYSERPKTVPARQASAAVGQGVLIEEYAKRLGAQDIVAAQLLVTRADFSDRRRYQNVFNTLSVLLKRGALPIINENDTVSIEELRFGDNDRLSAQVAALVHADLLVILTDVNGLYTADPGKDPSARLIAQVDAIDAQVERMAGDSDSDLGTGGMASKIEAAKVATAAGVPVVVTGPEVQKVLDAVEGQPVGTRFCAVKQAMNTRLQWMAFHAPLKGQIIVDDGAVEALSKRHTSLLPSGVTGVTGVFERGDVIEVVDEQGGYVGCGTARYTSEQLTRVKGMTSRQIQKLLGPEYSEAIHRDDWLSAGRIKKGE
jgi:glutamate 5-kinase